MKLLIDSQVIVWAALFPQNLREETRAALTDPSNKITFSAASIWELGLKIAAGRLHLPRDYVSKLLENNFNALNVTSAHANATAALPFIHGDPFDRMLIAQALCEGFVLVTSDRTIMRYDVPVMEA